MGINYENGFPTHFIDNWNYCECADNGSVWKIVHNLLMPTKIRFATRLPEDLTWHKWGGSSLLWLTRVDVTDDVEVVDPLDLRLPLLEHFALLDDVTLLDISAILFTMDYKRKNSFNTKQQHTTEGYSHRASVLTFALTLALTLERNTLVSIAPSTPSIDISINTMRQNSICFWTDPKASTLTSMWTSSVWTRLNCKLAH